MNKLRRARGGRGGAQARQGTGPRPGRALRPKRGARTKEKTQANDQVAPGQRRTPGGSRLNVIVHSVLPSPPSAAWTASQSSRRHVQRSCICRLRSQCPQPLICPDHHLVPAPQPRSAAARPPRGAEHHQRRQAATQGRSRLRRRPRACAAAARSAAHRSPHALSQPWRPRSRRRRTPSSSATSTAESLRTWCTSSASRCGPRRAARWQQRPPPALAAPLLHPSCRVPPAAAAACARRPPPYFSKQCSPPARRPHFYAPARPLPHPPRRVPWRQSRSSRACPELCPHVYFPARSFLLICTPPGGPRGVGQDRRGRARPARLCLHQIRVPGESRGCLA